VATLYESYIKKRQEIDILRKRRNDHSQAIVNVQAIDDAERRERKLESHAKVGKSFKADLKVFEDEL
jgi:uncharacterized protein involved in exopolysaccharide biosynthesis